jgi:hypothetical protein
MQAAINPIAERISRISVSSTMKVSAEADKLRGEGADVVDFGAGEPDFPTPDNIKQAAVRALEQNFTKYTAAGGTAELKKAVCESHAQDFGTSYGPSECMITVGGKHVIFNLIQALVNPGDEVVIPVPYWVTYQDVVNYAGGKCVFVNTDEAQGFALTAAMLEPHLTARTRMVIVNSPSNPSGAVVERDEFEKIFRLTSARGIYLMTDECYCKFLYGSEPFSIASLAGAKETVLVAGSLSKTYAMTGWRIVAEPFDLEPVFDLAEGGGGSLARPAGIGGHHAGGVSQAARFRGSAVARDSGCPVQRAAGRVLRVPQRERGHRQQRHRQHAAILGAPAGGGPRGSGAGGSVRYQPAHPHLLRDVDQGTGSRN